MATRNGDLIYVLDGDVNSSVRGDVVELLSLAGWRVKKFSDPEEFLFNVNLHRGAAVAVERALRRSAEQRRQKAIRDEARRLLELLTPREFEVMQLVIRGMLNKQIAAELGTAEQTVKIHRGRVMRKLGITSVADLVRLVEKAAGATPARHETKV